MPKGGKNCRSTEEVREILSSLGYELLYDYIPRKNTTRRVVIKDDIGYKYDVTINSIMDGHPPYFVYKNNPFSIENRKLWLKINRKTFYILENQTYINSHKILLFQCSACKDIFRMNWNNVSQNNECPICENRQVGKYNNLKYLRPDLAEEWNYKKNKGNPENYILGSSVSVWWICRDCGHEWRHKIISRSLGRGCPVCLMSSGEKTVRDLLCHFNIEFEQQKVYDDCKNTYRLPFDFYLPRYILCIEYDGILHYEDKFNSPKDFKRTKKNDKIKTKYCKDNNISLLRIPYWEFKNIKNILEETLFC